MMVDRNRTRFPREAVQTGAGAVHILVRGRHVLRLLTMLLAATVLAPLAGCHRRGSAQPLPVAVQVATLRQEPIVMETRYSATVREQHRFELSFKVPGMVVSLLQVKDPDGRLRDVHEGDVVTPDPAHPLARLDDSDYKRKVEGAQERLAQAQAKQRAAQAAVTSAETTFQRTKSLRESGAVAQQTYDDAVARRDAAEADLDAARRDVRGATVAVQQAEDDCRNCALVVTGPNVTVSRKYIEDNQRVPAGQPVFQLIDLSRVRVAFGVPDTQVSQFQLGQTFTVTADAFRGRRFLGRVTKILPTADLRTRTFEIEATVDDPQGLKPGMVVTIIVGRQENVVLLPMTAVQRGAGNDGFAVFAIVDEDGQKVARTRQVRLNGVYDNRIRLVESSESEIGAGDAVVVTGAFRLVDGQAVRVLEVPDSAETALQAGL
jgi:RND family efflux transporter MFP subunit